VSQLAEARVLLDTAAAPAPADARARAREEILIAEGSDWFWWYGDDHSSDHDPEFDDLFRRHLRNAYLSLNRPVPEELFVTNITTAPPAVLIEPPTGFIEPDIDGGVTHYFEWIGAGCVEAGRPGGAMQQAGERSAIVTLVEFGFDLQSLFVRLDGPGPMRSLLDRGVDVRVRFLKPAGVRVVMRPTDGGADVHLERRSAAGDGWEPAACGGLAAAIDRVLEVRIPFACLGAAPHDRIAFLVSVTRHGAELELHPRHGPIEIERPDARFPSRSWTA